MQRNMFGNGRTMARKGRYNRTFPVIFRGISAIRNQKAAELAILRQSYAEIGKVLGGINNHNRSLLNGYGAGPADELIANSDGKGV